MKRSLNHQFLPAILLASICWQEMSGFCRIRTVEVFTYLYFYNFADLASYLESELRQFRTYFRVHLNFKLSPDTAQIATYQNSQL